MQQRLGDRQWDHVGIDADRRRVHAAQRSRAKTSFLIDNGVPGQVGPADAGPEPFVLRPVDSGEPEPGGSTGEGSDLVRSTAARIVLLEAAAGDPVAAGIIARHARRAADYVRACAAKVGLRPDERIAVTLGGSVLAKDDVLRRETVDELIKELPAAVVITENAVPILGTMLDALAEGGVRPGPQERTNLLRWEHGRLIRGVPHRAPAPGTPRRCRSVRRPPHRRSSGRRRTGSDHLPG